MKSLAQLQITQEELSGSLFVTTLAEMIIKDAVANTIARNAVKINRDLVGSAGKTIEFPTRTGVVVSAWTENASGSLVTPSYVTVVATPVKYGAIVEITSEAIDASQFDIIEEALDSLSRAHADREDVVIVDALVDRLTDVATFAVAESATTAFTLSVGNIIAVLDVTLSGTTQVETTDYLLDHKNGVLHLVSAQGTGTPEILVTYEFAQSLTAVQSDTAGVLAYGDIVNALSEVKAANYRPNVLLLHPAQAGDIVKLQQFYDVSQYGSDVVTRTGELGKIAGLTVFVSTNIPDGVSVVVDSENAAKLVFKRDMTVKWDEDITLDKRLVAATAMYAAVVTRPAAICLITGMQNGEGR